MLDRVQRKTNSVKRVHAISTQRATASFECNGQISCGETQPSTKPNLAHTGLGIRLDLHASSAEHEMSIGVAQLEFAVRWVRQLQENPFFCGVS